MTALFSFTPPLPAEAPSPETAQAAATQAINHARQIGLALYLFDEKFGESPTTRTRKPVEAATGAKIPDDDSSANALLRQLFGAGLINREGVFFARIPGAKPGDDQTQGEQCLAQGENAFAYIPGQISKDHADRPMLLCPLIAGTTIFDPAPFGGKAVIQFMDNSVRTLPIEEDGRVFFNGVDLLSPENPVWGGKAPDIRYADLDLKAARVASDFLALESALEMFKVVAGNYPTTDQGLQALVTKPEVAPIPRRWVQIMNQIPEDPWGNAYRYRFLGTQDPHRPDLFSLGPDGREGTADDIMND